MGAIEIDNANVHTDNYEQIGRSRRVSYLGR